METQFANAGRHDAGNSFGVCLKRKLHSSDLSEASDCSFSSSDEKKQRIVLEETPAQNNNNMESSSFRETQIQRSNQESRAGDLCLANQLTQPTDLNGEEMETDTGDVEMGSAAEISAEVNTTNAVPSSGHVTSDMAAEDFVRSHRPDLLYCAPTACHPGGLWDVMLEMYHGL